MAIITKRSKSFKWERRESKYGQKQSTTPSSSTHASVQQSAPHSNTRSKEKTPGTALKVGKNGCWSVMSHGSRDDEALELFFCWRVGWKCASGALWWGAKPWVWFDFFAMGTVIPRRDCCRDRWSQSGRYWTQSGRASGIRYPWLGYFPPWRGIVLGFWWIFNARRSQRWDQKDHAPGERRVEDLVDSLEWDHCFPARGLICPALGFAWFSLPVSLGLIVLAYRRLGMKRLQRRGLGWIVGRFLLGFLGYICVGSLSENQSQNVGITVPEWDKTLKFS